MDTALCAPVVALTATLSALSLRVYVWAASFCRSASSCWAEAAGRIAWRDSPSALGMYVRPPISYKGEGCRCKSFSENVCATRHAKARFTGCHGAMVAILFHGY